MQLNPRLFTEFRKQLSISLSNEKSIAKPRGKMQDPQNNSCKQQIGPMRHPDIERLILIKIVDDKVTSYPDVLLKTTNKVGIKRVRHVGFLLFLFERSFCHCLTFFHF